MEGAKVDQFGAIGGNERAFAKVVVKVIDSTWTERTVRMTYELHLVGFWARGVLIVRTSPNEANRTYFMDSDSEDAIVKEVAEAGYRVSGDKGIAQLIDEAIKDYFQSNPKHRYVDKKPAEASA
jgi:hypothetical protein